MSKDLYCIRSDYTHRSEPSYFDDTPFKDEWQKEVYLRAAELMKLERLKSVYDVGCGSGYKLLEYLGAYDTVGLDVPETVRFLNNKYPDRAWKVSDFENCSYQRADLVICSDVIEHVIDPVKLMQFILFISAKWVILSTPDRDLIYPPDSPFIAGPPANLTHLREWSFNEFGNFISTFVQIQEHFISNKAQATQTIVASI